MAIMPQAFSDPWSVLLMSLQFYKTSGLFLPMEHPNLEAFSFFKTVLSGN
jgi:hypothetical protein